MAMKLLSELAVGDQIVTTRTVKVAWKSADNTKMNVVFDDDSIEVLSLSGEPAVEVLDG